MKIKEQGRGKHLGCLVYGFYRRVDGSPMQEAITITPGTAGVWQGVLYDRTPVILSPDNEGRYQITLPPSSALGDYTVQANERQLVIRVPDGVQSAALTELLVEVG